MDNTHKWHKAAEFFNVHGHYCISNGGGYEVEISTDGESAKLRQCWDGEPDMVTDWLPIEGVLNPDYEPRDDDDDDDELIFVIDPGGFDLPMNEVTKA